LNDLIQRLCHSDGKNELKEKNKKEK